MSLDQRLIGCAGTYQLFAQEFHFFPFAQTLQFFIPRVKHSGAAAGVHRVQSLEKFPPFRLNGFRRYDKRALLNAAI